MYGNDFGTPRHYPSLMAIPPPPPDYYAWLLRLWRESARSVWRISLENVVTHERKGFADLQELLLYLQSVAAEADVNADQADVEEG